MSPNFDSMIAKLIVTGATREQAIRRARRALAEFRVEGVATVLPFHQAVMAHDDFTAADTFAVHTRWIETDFAEHVTIAPRSAASADPGCCARLSKSTASATNWACPPRFCVGSA